MDTLSFSPLPFTRTEDIAGSLWIEREGFVDESVVAAMAIGPRYERSFSYPQDLALAADDLDFAGWCLSAPQALKLAASTEIDEVPVAVIPLMPEIVSYESTRQPVQVASGRLVLITVLLSILTLGAAFHTFSPKSEFSFRKLLPQVRLLHGESTAAVSR
jgi:hypothetical protein